MTARSLTSKTIEFAKSPCSGFSEECPESGRVKLWAQEQISADLMSDALKEMGVKPGRVKVAVIDTGFDEKKYRKDILAASTQFIGENAGTDRVGHGTGVASLIFGNNGVGVAPGEHFSSYALSFPPIPTVLSGTDFWSRPLVDAALQACKDGNEVISLSMGVTYDQTGQDPIEVRFAQELQQLKKIGLPRGRSSRQCWSET